MKKTAELLDIAYEQPVKMDDLAGDALISRFMTRLEKEGEELDLPAGHVIFERGTILKCAYVIRSGSTRSFRVTREGTEYVYWNSRLDNDRTIGFPSALTGHPVSISVAAETRVELTVVKKARLLELIASEPLCALASCRLVAAKFVNTSEDMHSRTEESSRKRFYSLLLKLAVGGEQSGTSSEQVQAAINQQDVSNYLGVNRTTTFRAFKELQNEGILGYEKGSYIVKDIEALKRYCLEEI